MFRPILLAIGITFLSVTAVAQKNVVGNWVGKMHFDESQMKAATPQQQKQLKNGIEAVKKYRINLTLNKDLTLRWTYDGAATGHPIDNRGTYTVSGNTIVIRLKTSNGTQIIKGGAAPKLGKISKDWKTITLPQGPTKMVFTRAKK